MNRIFILFFILFQGCQTTSSKKDCIDLSGKMDMKIINLKYFSLQVPNTFEYINNNLLHDSYTGKIVCGTIEMFFEYGNYEWDNFPLNENEYLASENWYEPMPLEIKQFDVKRANDSIKTKYPKCDYYAVEKNTKETIPIYIPDEVRKYDIRHTIRDSVKVKMAVSQEKNNINVWLQMQNMRIKSKHGGKKLSLHTNCANYKEKELILKIYETIKFIE